MLDATQNNRGRSRDLFVIKANVRLGFFKLNITYFCLLFVRTKDERDGEKDPRSARVPSGPGWKQSSFKSVLPRASWARPTVSVQQRLPQDGPPPRGLSGETPRALNLCSVFFFQSWIGLMFFMF